MYTTMTRLMQTVLRKGGGLRGWRLLSLMALAFGLSVAVATAGDPGWTAPNMLDNMTIYAKVNNPDGSPFTTAGSKIAAFKGASCRSDGVAFADPTNAPGLFIVTALGDASPIAQGGLNENGTSFTLHLWGGPSDDRLYAITPDFPFQANGELGSYGSPQTFTMVLSVDAASPGTAAGIGTQTVTVADQVAVNEGVLQSFSVTTSGGTGNRTFVWTVNGTQVGGNSSTLDYTPDFTTVAHPNPSSGTLTVLCTITDSATPAAQATVTWSDFVVRDVDRGPTDPTVTILPADPITTDDLTLQGYPNLSTDADGDGITYTIQWTRGATTVNGAPLAAVWTARGETWEVAVTAHTDPYGSGQVNSQTVTAQVTILNAAPVATAQTTPEITMNSQDVALTLAGTDADNDPLIFQLVDDPTHGPGCTSNNGTLADFDANSGALTYTPATDFLGDDTFQFQVSDDNGTTWSTAATVTLPVVQELLISLDVTGASVDAIEVGTTGAATDGVNPGLDYLAPPLRPELGDVRLVSPQPTAPARVFLIRDMRRVVGGARFQVEVRPGDTDPVVLSWVPADLPADQQWHIWRLTGLDGTAVAGTAIDMATATQTTPIAADINHVPVYLMIGKPSAIGVTDVQPLRGVPAGGENIVITGTGFVAGCAVDFSGTPAAQVTVDSATQLTVRTPAYANYSAVVTVTNPEGGSATFVTPVLFNHAPVANAGGYTIGMGAGVTLTGIASADPDTAFGDTLTYAWDLDNNGTYETTVADTAALEPNAWTLVLTSAELGNRVKGTYTIGLQVKDALNATGTATATLVITNLVPVADAGGPYTMDVGSSITLAGSATDPDTAFGDSLTYAWDLDGDGQYDDATGTTPTLSGLTVGVHTVGLQVSDLFGGVATDSASVTVLGTMPIPAFTMDPLNPDRAQLVTFNASASYHPYPGRSIVAYEWDFHYNGTTFNVRKTGVQVQTAFPERLVYPVALRVRDSSNPAKEAILVQNLSVSGNNAPPTAEAGGPYTATKASGVVLAGSGTDPDTAFGDTLTFAWDLDGDLQYDDATGAGPALDWMALYNLNLADGVQHTIGLKVTDSFGASGTDTAVLTAPANTAPVAVAGGPYLTPVFLDLALDGSASHDPDPATPIVSYRWKLDGTLVGTTATPTLAWSGLLNGLAVGQHALTLTVTDSLGLARTAATTVTIANDPDLDARAWTFTFDVAFGSHDTLTVGVTPAASDAPGAEDVLASGPAFDGSYTVLYAPDGTALQTSLLDSDSDHNNIPDTYEAWILQVTAGDFDPCLLKWDSASVSSSRGMWLVEVEPGPAGNPPALDGRAVLPLNAIDMALEDFVFVDTNETKYFRVVSGWVEFALHLEPGYNMVSLPIQPFDGGATVMGHSDVVQVNGWDPLAGDYTAPTTMDPLAGYWVTLDAQAATDILVKGMPISDRNYPLSAGYQLVGFAVAQALAANNGIFFPGYWYNPVDAIYELLLPGGQVARGRVYWFYVLSPNTILNPAP